MELGEEHGYRNAQATVLAPTGTIGFMMDCDTTGVEPDIALVKYKKLVGGGLMKIVNQTVPMALEKLGYTQSQVEAIIDYIDENETIEGAPGLKESHLPVFDCAFKAAKGQRSIHYMGHIKMMGATQPFISGAISKTVNVPKEATVEEIMQAYIQSWKLGAKAISIYRDGSKRTQPLNTSKDKDAEGARGSAERSSTPWRGAGPAQAARRTPRDHAQVRYRGARGVHHGRPVRGRTAGRDLPGDGEGRLDDFGVRRRVRAGDFVRAPVRRAAPGAGGQVQPRPLRAVGHDEEPGDPVREIDRGLHLPVDGVQVPVAEAQFHAGVNGASSRTRNGHAGADRRTPGGAQAGRDALLDDPESGRCAAMLDVRLDHDPQRRVLQVRQLRNTSGCA